LTGLFDGYRQTLGEAFDATAELLTEYGPRYRHWAVAYSGGKDSSAALTAAVHLIQSGRVPGPDRLTVLYADTRMELPPLHAGALAMLARLRDRRARRPGRPAGHGRPVLCVHVRPRGAAAVEHVPLVYRPAQDRRWPRRPRPRPGRQGAHADRGADRGVGPAGPGIAAACSRDGAECGQGGLHLALAGSGTTTSTGSSSPAREGDPCDTLAPILHWRVCHVWDWLLGDDAESVDHPFLDLTELVAEAYGDGGGSKLIESATRTGCVGCNLASRDVALERLTRRPAWAYLEPLKRLRPMYATLKLRATGCGSRAARRGRTVRSARTRTGWGR
jgi:DNA sulfur modification protein DndC